MDYELKVVKGQVKLIPIMAHKVLNKLQADPRLFSLKKQNEKKKDKDSD